MTIHPAGRCACGARMWDVDGAPESCDQCEKREAVEAEIRDEVEWAS